MFLHEFGTNLGFPVCKHIRQTERGRKRESLKQMQGEVIFSGWLLSVPVRLTSVRFTSVHGELRFKGELVRAVLG